MATYDGVQLHLYLDGKEVAAFASSLELLDTPSPLRVGAVGSYSNKLVGAIDEVAICSHALSSARIAAHYSAAVN